VIVDDAEVSEGRVGERIGLVGDAVEHGAFRDFPQPPTNEAGNRGS
jgi:hypothetical protein